MLSACPALQLMRVPYSVTTGAARSHSEAEREGYDYVPRPRNYKPTHQYILCPIEGDSLIEAGVYSGDIALIRTTYDVSEFVPGDPLAVWTPQTGLVCKFVYFDPFRELVRLASASPDYPDMVLDSSDVVIKGYVEYTIHFLKPRQVLPSAAGKVLPFRF